MQSLGRYRVLMLATLLLPVVVAAPVARAGQRNAAEAAPPAKPANQKQFGKVTLYYGTMEIVSNRKIKGGQLDVRGEEGGDAKLTSDRFDMAAPRILIEGTNSLVKTGTATGGVKLKVRDKLTDGGVRLTDITCPTAIFTAVQGEKTDLKPAHIDLKGPVHYTVRDPGLDPNDPLDGEAAGGYIEFTDADTTTIRFAKGHASGTPLEVEKKPQPEKKP